LHGRVGVEVGLGEGEGVMVVVVEEVGGNRKCKN